MEPSIYDYFSDKLGRAPRDKTLRNLPVDSGCGDDCKAAIDHAQALIALIKTGGVANSDAIVEAVDRTVQVFWRG